jgi:hypothetical protein
VRDLLTLQSLAGNGAVEAWLSQQVVARAPDPPAAGGGGAASPGLIVEDSAEPEPHQQRRSEFTAALRAALAATVAEATAGSPWTPPTDAELDAQLAPYRGLDAAALEQAIKRDAPGATGATTAAGLIPPATARARAAIQAEVSGAAEQVADVATQVVQGAASVLHGIVSILFKRRGERRAVPHALGDVVRRLGPGRPLDGGVRTHLEPALGGDLSGVRVHTDGAAAGLSDELDARAFTVGGHVAFGRDEYRPGTPAGDALLAHELAHVAQQAGGPIEGGATEEVEADADRAAAHAVGTLWASSDLADQLLQGAGPTRVGAGAGLRRCSRKPADPPTMAFNLPDDPAPLSSPGERVLFSSLGTSLRPTEFETVYTTVGGSFDSPGGAATKTFPGHGAAELSFFIPAGWNGTDPVTVDFLIRRKSDGATFSAKSWRFGKKAFVPTAMAQFEHGPQPVSANGEVEFSYLLNPQPPAGWTGDAGGPYYEHETILERFEGQTCNVTQAELRPEFAAAHPDLTTPEAIAGFFFNPQAFHASFTVGRSDIIIDRNGANGVADGATRLLLQLTKPKAIEWDHFQVYEAQPGVVLGRYTIRRTMQTNGALSIEKLGP